MSSTRTITNLDGRVIERIRTVPDFAQYIRDVTHYGAAGAAIQKMMRLPLYDQIRVITGSIPHTTQLLRKDFVRGVLLLIEMELYEEKTIPSGIVLTHQLTDLAACFGNTRLFEEFYKLARRTRLKSGVATYNAGISIPLILNTGLDMDFFITPVSPGGYRMHPDPLRVRTILKSKGVHKRIVAIPSEVNAMTRRYLKDMGISLMISP